MRYVYGSRRNNSLYIIFDGRLEQRNPESPGFASEQKPIESEKVSVVLLTWILPLLNHPLSAIHRHLKTKLYRRILVDVWITARSLKAEE